MGKANKIRRYQRKDYSSVVEFPVEIIGRDGVVRRYSFEESIRLYQRRIVSADLRYNDRELIQAEKQHCQHRIEQLRRSFFAHHGWPAVEIVDHVGGVPGVLAAEVAAFLRRVLSTVAPMPERYAFSLLDTAETHRVYFVQPPAASLTVDAPIEGHFLLYVFPFTTSGTSPSREAFFEMVKVLDGVRVTGGQSVEAMVAFFHTHDCGLILTGSGSLAQTAAARHDPDTDSEELSWASESPSDPVETGMRMLGQGRLEEALRQFTSAYTIHHFRRVAYLGAAVVADQLGLDDETETATVMGCRYFPGDPALEYHRGICLMRQRKFGRALHVFRSIGGWSSGQYPLRLMVCLCLLADQQFSAGRAALRLIHSEQFAQDPHLGSIVRWVRAQQWARDILLGGSLGAAVLGVCAAIAGWSYIGIFIMVAGVALWRMVMKSWHRQLTAQIAGGSSHRMRLASSAVLMDDRPMNSHQ